MKNPPLANLWSRENDTNVISEAPEGYTAGILVALASTLVAMASTSSSLRILLIFRHWRVVRISEFQRSQLTALAISKLAMPIPRFRVWRAWRGIGVCGAVLLALCVERPGVGKVAPMCDLLCTTCCCVDVLFKQRTERTKSE